MLPPAPIQTLLATLLAVLCRANIPIAAAAVWVSNPASWAIILKHQRDIGRALLPPADGKVDVGFGIGFESLRSVTLGVLITAMIVGPIGYGLMYFFWGVFDRGKRLVGSGGGESTRSGAFAELDLGDGPAAEGCAEPASDDDLGEVRAGVAAGAALGEGADDDVGDGADGERRGEERRDE